MVDLKLRSPAFGDQGPIPDRFSRQGGNVSPPLAWSQAPGDAAELLLVCEDPDAPRGTFLHWLVTGIDPATSSLTEGQVPDNVRQWPNGFGNNGWSGPQPPAGDPPHHYILQLHALARPAQLPPQPSVEQVHNAIETAEPLARGTLTGTYTR